MLQRIVRKLYITFTICMILYAFFDILPNIFCLRKSKNCSSMWHKKEVLPVVEPPTNKLLATTAPLLARSSATVKTTVRPVVQSPKQLRAQYLQDLLKCRNRTLARTTLQYDQYWIIRNFVRGDLSSHMGCAESVTYCSIGDYTYFDALPTLVTRWQAPISFALYAPGFDVFSAIDSIQYARNCMPANDLIRQYVTFHIFFPTRHRPDYVPLTEDEVLNWSYNCARDKPPYTDVDRTETYMRWVNQKFPSNIARNIARQGVNTHFILVADLDMWPSVGLVDAFLDMVARNERKILSGKSPSVYSLPVFEVARNVEAPSNKQDLLEMLANGIAKCLFCSTMPNYNEWVNATFLEDMSAFTARPIEGIFRHWRFFFISNNKEPMYDERFNWDTMFDHLMHDYVMCLLDYQYHVLHPAFLVHRGDLLTNPRQSRHANAVLSIVKKKLEPEYRLLYGEKSECVV